MLMHVDILPESRSPVYTLVMSDAEAKDLATALARSRYLGAQSTTALAVALFETYDKPTLVQVA